MPMIKNGKIQTLQWNARKIHFTGRDGNDEQAFQLLVKGQKYLEIKKIFNNS